MSVEARKYVPAPREINENVVDSLYVMFESMHRGVRGEEYHELPIDAFGNVYRIRDKGRGEVDVFLISADAPTYETTERATDRLRFRFAPSGEAVEIARVVSPEEENGDAYAILYSQGGAAVTDKVVNTFIEILTAHHSA